MDPEVTAALAAEYRAYITDKQWKGRGDFGTITGDNLASYLLEAYLEPSCQRFLLSLDSESRESYLVEHPWICWDGRCATFTFQSFVQYCGRSKTQPAFDDRALHMEPAIFGTEIINARHFTPWGSALGGGEPTVEPEVAEKEKMMNAMTFLPQGGDCAKYWWIRHGTCDRDTSLPVIVGLATALENAGATVNARLVWDGGHGADDEKQEMITWIKEIL
jgi:hypothetical protein